MAWTAEEWKSWNEKALEYLRSVTGREDSNAHLIDEIACVEMLVRKLRSQNKALKRKVLDLAGPGKLSELEKALLNE